MTEEKKEKRTYETGSITPLGNNKYRLRVSGGKGIGGSYNRPSKNITAKSLKDAERQLALFVEEERNRSGNGKTIAWLVDQFVELKVSKLRYNSQKNYNNSCRRIKAGMGHVKLNDLKPTDIEKLYNMLENPKSKELDGLKCGLSPASMHLFHGHMGALLYWGYKKEILDRPVIDKVDAPGAPDSKKRSLSIEEIINLKKVFDAQKPVWRTIGYFAMQSGMRRGEIVGLKWNDVNLETGEVTINKQMIARKKTEGGQCLAPPKTKKSVREIIVDANMLKAWKEEQRKISIEDPTDKWKDGFIFTVTCGKSIGAPINVDHVSTKFTNMFKKAGIFGVTLHGLRHNCATWLLISGAPEADTAAFMGHSSIIITKKRYIHAQQGYAKKISDIISKTDLV